jgi:formylglycine-generating enzyme required for sulfatase activity
MCKNKSHSDHMRVLRGGYWLAFAWGCRSAYRYAYLHSGSYGYFGFRVARGTKHVER